MLEKYTKHVENSERRAREEQYDDMLLSWLFLIQQYGMYIYGTPAATYV